jgi:hypothetical protein
MTIYLLCEHGVDWHEWSVLGWHADRAVLEAEAIRMEWALYEAERAGYQSIGGAVRLSPDQTTYRRYFVEAVAEWCAVGSPKGNT